MFQRCLLPTLSGFYKTTQCNIPKQSSSHLLPLSLPRILLQKCGKVLGLDLLAQAVDDAKSNAEINGIVNCDFFVGKAEDILCSVMNRAVKEDVLAVVDPPRAGLRKDFILLIIFCNLS